MFTTIKKSKVKSRLIIVLITIFCVCSILAFTNGKQISSASAYSGDDVGTTYSNSTNLCYLGTSWAYQLRRFTPTESGTYRIYSTKTSGDPYVFVSTSSNANTVASNLQSYGQQNDTSRSYSIAYDDDSNGNNDFNLNVYLNAGQTYYIYASRYSMSSDTNYTWYISPVSYYTVTLNKNGGSGGNSNLYGGYPTSGSKPNTSYYSTSPSYASTNYVSIPTKTGYAFQGYYTSANSGTQVISSNGYINNTILDDYANTTVYAHWNPNTYYVTYNANGGSGTTATQTANYGTRYTYSACGFTRTGYTFAGWANSSNGAVTNQPGYYFSNLTTTNGGTINRYAVWNANSYSIAYNANGGNGSMTSTAAVYNQSVALRTNTFTRTGYTFAGWANSSNGSVVYNNSQYVSNLSSSNNAIATLYAVWTPNRYFVSLLNTNATTNGTTSVNATFNSLLPSITPAQRVGYTLDGYYSEENGSGTKYYNTNGVSVTNYAAASNSTLYPNWIANSSTVTVDLNGGVSGQTLPVSASYDSPIVLQTPMWTDSTNYDNGSYLFRGWKITSNNVSENAYYTIGEDTTRRQLNNDSTFGFEVVGAEVRLYNVTTANNAAITIEAQWHDNSFTATFLDNDGSELSTVSDIDYSNTVTVPSNPNKASDDTFNYEFIGWYCSDDGQIYDANANTVKTAGQYITDEKYNLEFTAVYEVTYINVLELVGSLGNENLVNNTLILNPEDSNIDIITKFRVNTNAGINSLLLVLDYNKDIFTLKNINITDADGNNISDLLGFTWQITDNYTTAEVVKLIFEGSTKTTATNGLNDNFVEITYELENAVGGEYDFGFVTDYAENTRDIVTHNDRSEAYEWLTDAGKLGEQSEVKIVIDTTHINVIVREVGSIEIDANQSKIYNSTAMTISDIQELIQKELNYAYNGYNDTSKNLTITWYEANGTTVISAPKNVGNYVIGISAAESNYFTPVLEVKQSFSITQAPLTITADDEEISYFENAPSYTYSVDGLYAGDELTGTALYDCAYIKGNNIGEYPISVSGLTNSNYDISFTNGTLTVIQAINEWTTALSYNDLVWTGSAINASANAKFGEVSYRFSTDGTTWSNTVPTDAGTYIVDATVIGNDNYTGLYSQDGFVISRAIITKADGYENLDAWLDAVISVSDKTYNATKQEWTLSDISNAPDYTTIFSVGYATTDPEQDYVNAGSPKLLVTINADNNHQFDEDVYTYEFLATATINPYDVIITATNQSMVYTGYEPSALAQLYTISVASGDVPQFVLNDDLQVTITKSTGVAIGDYALTPLGINPNYTYTYTDGRFTITQLFIAIPTFDSYVYDKTEKIPTVDDDDSYTIIVTGQTNAGTYTLVLSLKDTINTAWQNIPTITSTKVEGTTYYEYNGENYYRVISPDFSRNVIYYTYNGTAEVYDKAASFVEETTYYTLNDGSYVVALGLTEFAEGVNYYTKSIVDVYAPVEITSANGTSNVTLDWTILPTQVTVDIDNKTSVYLDALEALTSQVTAGTVYEDDDLGITLDTTAEVNSDAGTYNITGQASNTNYLVTFINGTYTITPIILGQGTVDNPDFTEIIAQISSGDGKYYTGSEITWAKSEFTENVDGVEISSVAKQNGVEYIHVKTDDSKYYYVVTLNVSNSTNYRFINNTTSINENVEVKILQADNTWDTNPSVTASTVDDVSTSSDAHFGGDAEVTYYTDSNCNTQLVGSFSADHTYYAKFVVNGNTDYKTLEAIVSFKVGFNSIGLPTVTIDSVTVNAGESRTITYDGMEHSFVIAIGHYTITYSKEDNTYKNVGSYTATLSLDENYSWSDDSITDRVYTFVIDKKILTISADNKTIMYSSAIPELTATANGFVVGEDFATYDVTISNYLTTTYTATTAVGTYTNGIYFVDNAETALEVEISNYDVSLVLGNYQVTSYIFDFTTLGLNFEDLTVTYDSELHSITITVAEGKIMPANLSVSYTYDGEAVSGKENVKFVNNAVASYTVVASFEVTGETSENYTVPVDRTAYLTINQFDLTVTADAQNSDYTGNEPTVTQNDVTLSVHEGEVPAFVASDNLSFTITKQNGVNAGTYTLTPSLINRNYNFTFVNGIYTINQATNTWTTELWTLDDESEIVYDKYVIERVIDYEAIAQFGQTVFTFYDEQGNQLENAPKNAGTYYIVATVTGNENYTGLVAGLNDSTKTKLFIIQKANFNMSGVTFVNKTVTYNSASQLITITGSTPAGVSVSYSPTNSYINANTYTVTANFSVTDNANYNVPEALTADLTISPAIITITADDKTSKYSQDIVNLTYRLGDREQIYNNDFVPVLSTTATSESIVGEYPITVSASNSNYEITLVNGVYSITIFDLNSVSLTALNVEYLQELNIRYSATFGTVVITYSTDDITYSATEPKNVDSYYVKAEVVGTDNYNSASQTTTFDITKATLSDVVFSYNKDTATWEAITTTTANETIDTTVVYRLSEVGDNLVSRQIIADRTGTYTVYAIPADTANYNGSDTTTLTVYSVSFADGAHSKNSDVATDIPSINYVFANETVTEPNEPTITGYNFQYWEIVVGNGAFSFATGINENTTLTAKWTIKSFTITWKVNGSVVETDEVEYMALPTFDGATPTMTTTAEYTYAFDTWKDEITNGVVVVATENACYIAVFDKTANTYTITYYVSKDNGAYEVYKTVNRAYALDIEDEILASKTWFKAHTWYCNEDRTTSAPETMTASNLSLYGAYVFDIGKGDVNANGFVTADDITLYRKVIVGGYDITVVETGTEFDLVDSGNYDVSTLYYLERVSDINEDLSKDIRDISTIRMSIVKGYNYYINSNHNVTGEEVEDEYFNDIGAVHNVEYATDENALVGNTVVENVITLAKLENATENANMSIAINITNATANVTNGNAIIDVLDAETSIWNDVKGQNANLLNYAIVSGEKDILTVYFNLADGHTYNGTYTLKIDIDGVNTAFVEQTFTIKFDEIAAII